jgi:hypothetical protein
MKHLFYFLTVFPILWEVITLVKVNKVHQFILNLKTIEGKSFDKYTRTQKSFSIYMIGYIIWTFIGFFTFQWVVFLVLFLLGFIHKKYAWFRWVDSLITFIMLCFIVINAYHFKFDVCKWLLSMII